jgi:class 3 adenylate cyclase
MDAALSGLDADVRRFVALHDGSIVKARGEGDSHFAVFGEASKAVTAAAALQRRADRRLEVRACVLVDEARPRDEDYIGAVVNHGARIRSVAHGGQVVATRSAADVAAPHLLTDLTFHPLGTHRVADVPTPVELLQLCGPGLRRSFPPLLTRAFSTSAMMAVVAVDEVRSIDRLRHGDAEVLAWQRELIHGLRDLSDAHDGHHLKLLGDGCSVAFDDPRTALAFVQEVHGRGPFRVGVAVGLVELIEGELTGRTVFDAHRLMRHADPGETRCCGVVQALCPVTPSG